MEHGPRLVLALKRLSVEQIDAQGRWGKGPLREARRIRLARLLRRFQVAIGTGRARRGITASNRVHPTVA